MKNTANSLCLHATKKVHRSHIKFVAKNLLSCWQQSRAPGSRQGFLCPEFTHPHGAELREVSMYELTVKSGMQSGHVCSIPKDDVLGFWPEILVHSPETQHKAWPSLFCLPFCRLLYDIPKCSSIPRTSSSSPWQQHFSWALWNPLPLGNNNPCLAPFQLPWIFEATTPSVFQGLALYSDLLRSQNPYSLLYSGKEEFNPLDQSLYTQTTGLYK